MALARGKAKAKKPEPTTREADQERAPGHALEPDEALPDLVRLREIIEALWLPAGLSESENADRLRVAIERIESIKPDGELESMLATQMIATHSAAMECLKRAMLEGQSFEGRHQNLKHATKLLATYVRQMEALDKHRGKGQQKVTVEHVHVEAGGQAIVGNVEAGGRKRRPKRGSAAIEHAPEAPLENPAPAESAKRRR